MKQVHRSPKSAILPSVISNFYDPLPIWSSNWHHFFLLGMAVACLNKNLNEKYGAVNFRAESMDGHKKFM